MVLLCCNLLASHNRMLRSWLALARSRPSGEKATARTASLCPSSVLSNRPVGTHHTRIVWSLLAVANRLPCQANASDSTATECASHSLARVPARYSQSRTTPCSSPLARYVPVGEKTKPLIAALWPARVLPG